MSTCDPVSNIFTLSCELVNNGKSVRNVRQKIKNEQAASITVIVKLLCVMHVTSVRN